MNPVLVHSKILEGQGQSQLIQNIKTTIKKVAILERNKMSPPLYSGACREFYLAI